MNCRVLAAGWPFAGLLELEANRVDTVLECARRSGIIAQDDGGSGILVYEAEGPLYVSVELEPTTAVYGVDGYPIALSDLHPGDAVRVVQELRDSRWVTTEVRVFRRSSEKSTAPARSS
jgi:hypothetical protein